MPIRRLTAPTLLPLLAATLLVAALLAATAARAAPTLDDVNLGEYASGPRISAADLQGRVVVFEYWGQHCPPCLASIPHLADIQARYPHKALLVVANHCQEGGAANAAKVWADRQGGNQVIVINQGNLRGANVGAIPRAFVFDAFGKCVFDGSPHDGGFDGAISAAVNASPGAAGVARVMAARANAEKLFGKDIPAPLMEVAAQAADTSRSSASAMGLLARAAKYKDPKIAASAQDMIEAFGKAVTAEFAAGEAKAESDPAAAMAAMETIARWAPQTPEKAKASANLAKWRHDPAFAKELDADKVWLRLKAQADRVDFEKHPQAKPPSTLTSDYKYLLHNPRLAGTKGLEKAKAAAAGWNMDPETGHPTASKAH